MPHHRFSENLLFLSSWPFCGLDIIDHSIFITRISSLFGAHGSVLNWFKPYLSSRSFRVKCHSSFSFYCISSCGIPQCSVLGPLLFIMYTTQLSTPIIFISLFKLSPSCWRYALFLLFYLSNLDSIIIHFQNALQAISSWIFANLLTLSASKTEFFLIGLKQQLVKINSCSLDTIHYARNLGVFLMNILVFWPNVCFF